MATSKAQEEALSTQITYFVKDIWRHWIWFIGSSGLAIILAYLEEGGAVIPHWVFWALGASGFVIATFLAWRDERRGKQKALDEIEKTKEPPEVDGMWRRPFDELHMTIDQVGSEIISMFSAGKYDHVLKGRFDPKTRKFDQVTIRTNTQSGIRLVMRGTVESYKNRLIVTTMGTDGAEGAREFNEVSILERMTG